MEKTAIRWCDSTWNFLTGCTHVSEECRMCYAEVIATSPRFANGFPNGFTPTFKAARLGQPASWRQPRRIFVNSMSDMHHQDFTRDQVDAGYDAMVATPRHQYLVLTKRPQRMADYFVGPDGWLERRGLDAVPDHIWLGTSIGLDKYTFRADHLRRIPVGVRFLSCEPLLGPLPSLNLDGIAWVIVGGESGNGTRNFRKMDLDWARDLRDRCAAARVAFFYKQDSGVRTELRIELDGERIEQWPRPHPNETPVLL